MDINTASQVLDVLSFFLIQPELARILLGRERLSSIAVWVRKVALWASWSLQKSVIRTRFRLDRRTEPILSRQSYYSVLRYQLNLHQELPSTDGERSEYLWLNMKDLLQGLAPKDRNLQELLDAGELEQAMKRILSAHSLMNFDKPAIFEVSTPRDWILTFRRFAIGFVWLAVLTALIWWLVSQLWSEAVPRWGCSLITLITIVATLARGLYRLHLQAVIGTGLSADKLPDSIQLPEISHIKIRRLYWHYCLNRAISMMLGVGILFVVGLLLLHEARVLVLGENLVTIFAGLAFGVALTLSFAVLKVAFFLPILAFLSIIAWITVLGAQEKVSRLMIISGILCFGLARLLSSI